MITYWFIWLLLCSNPKNTDYFQYVILGLWKEVLILSKYEIFSLRNDLGFQVYKLYLLK